MFAFFCFLFYNFYMTDKKLEMKKKLDAVLEFIKNYSVDNGFPPSIREICCELNISSTATAYYYVNKLQQRGDITKSRQKNRALEVKDLQRIDNRFQAVPLVGRVHAGALSLAEENLDDTFSFSNNLFGSDDLFMLTVTGDSMIEAGINDGDMVVVKKQPVANNGDIVVALVNDEATVKRFFKRSNCFLLHPENKEYNDIIVCKLDILGVVIGLIRKFR